MKLEAALLFRQKARAALFFQFRRGRAGCHGDVSERIISQPHFTNISFKNYLYLLLVNVEC